MHRGAAMLAPPVAKAKTKVAFGSPGRDAAQRSIFPTQPFDSGTGAGERASVSWNFADIPIHPYMKPAAEIRGSMQREANEAEAERAARSFATLSSSAPAPRENEQPGPLPRHSSAAPVYGGRKLPDPARQMFEYAFGYDLRTIRLHDDAISGRVARGIGATAFA